MIPAVQALGESVFANAQPAFARCHRATGPDTIYNSSALVLPLSDDGRHVNMFIATRITLFNEDAIPSQNWLERTRLRLGMCEIHQVPDLERGCRDWKGISLADGHRTSAKQMVTAGLRNCGKYLKAASRFITVSAR
jgi:hypothetical protein